MTDSRIVLGYEFGSMTDYWTKIANWQDYTHTLSDCNGLMWLVAGLN